MAIKLTKRRYLYITVDAWADIESITNICDEEVGFIMETKKTIFKNSVRYTISKVHLPKQQVHGTTCELDKEDQHNIVMSLKNPNSIRTWGHSHVNMATNPSTQDTNELETLVSGVKDFYIMIIVNKKGFLNVTIVDKEDCIEITQADFEIEKPDGSMSYEAWKLFIKATVLPKPVQVPKVYDYRKRTDGMSEYQRSLLDISCNHNYTNPKTGGKNKAKGKGSKKTKEPKLSAKEEARLKAMTDAMYENCHNCKGLVPIDESFYNEFTHDTWCRACVKALPLIRHDNFVDLSEFSSGSEEELEKEGVVGV